MAVPNNPQDYKRFLALAELLTTVDSGLKIYVSKSDRIGKSYVLIESSGTVDTTEMLSLFK